MICSAIPFVQYQQIQVPKFYVTFPLIQTSISDVALSSEMVAGANIMNVFS